MNEAPDPRAAFNLPIVAVLQCASCPTRVHIRAKCNFAIELAMSEGWMIVNRKKGIVECPVHNPSHVAFYEARSKSYAKLA